jgi:hypothetical protein
LLSEGVHFDCGTNVRLEDKPQRQSQVGKGVTMQQSPVPIPVSNRQILTTENVGKNESFLSGVSWPAVIGGAFASASLALILLSLGTGLGFSAVSPWSNFGASASTIGKAAIAWLILTQIIASAMGGYLAGRLRTKWANVHTDEVYFRDTAHGFLVWAVGLVITASLLASAATSLTGAEVRGSRSAVGNSGADASVLDPNAYLVDTLLRSNAAPDQNQPIIRGEVTRMFSHALAHGALAPADKSYLAQVVSARTGLGQSDAEKRVSDVFGEAQQSAEITRKSVAHLSLWLFVALLSGAFCASYAGTIGGKQRDNVLV